MGGGGLVLRLVIFMDGLTYLQALGVVSGVEERGTNLRLVNAPGAERLEDGDRLFLALHLVGVFVSTARE